MAGEAACGTSISEPGTGRDGAAITTTAERHADEYVLNGRKTWACTCPVAAFMIVLAKTEPDAAHGGIGTFVVPTETRGFVVEPELPTMGLRASPTAELSLSAVRVPAEYRIGRENEGFYQLREFFDENRVLDAANALGAAAGALRYAYEYAGERSAFGQPIGELQGLRGLLADMATKVETA